MLRLDKEGMPMIAESPGARQPAPTIMAAGRARAARAEVERRWETLPALPAARAALADPRTLAEVALYRGHIEQCIGAVRVPVGLAGPLRIRGAHARGDFAVPLATTEATLVASYGRGARLITEAGGCAALLVEEGLGRSPGFAFEAVDECARFVTWALGEVAAFRRAAAATTEHGRLTDVGVTIEGNHVYLDCRFTTGDAAGQNMVTLATEAICAYIAAHSPVAARASFLECNGSGDKKASVRALGSVRGRRVTAEVVVPAALVRRRLRTTPARMAEYARMATTSSLLTGTVGAQGHFANGLAALFIACGQDAACVAESAVGITRLEETSAGDLYAAVTLPALVVGTVGGGTALPGQRACLELMGLAGEGHARALAEVCAALCLAGELSLVGAICAGSFARAHRRLARDLAPAPAPAEGGDYA
jgi:hydroxymethylglutaryl-CoA reductase (NADPH)